MKIALITGASSGIGREFILQMDAIFSNIDEFWLVARREDALKELSGALQHRSRIFAVDLTKKGHLDRLERALYAEHAQVCILVNAAGYGLMGEFQRADRKETLGMIRLNCEALTDLTHRVLPCMAKNGRILQLASSAAFLPQIDFAVYAASKSYVLSFSRALRQELKERGISVTAVCPGPVDTPFFDIAEKYGKTLALKKYAMVSPERVVSQALRDAYHKRSRSVCSLPIQMLDICAKLLPHDLLLGGMSALKIYESGESGRRENTDAAGAERNVPT